jgi:hypothetical protein
MPNMDSRPSSFFDADSSALCQSKLSANASAANLAPPFRDTQALNRGICTHPTHTSNGPVSSRCKDPT